MSDISSAWQDAMKSRFDDKITKEQRMKYFGDSLLASWNTEFEHVCWGSKQFSEISFHTLLGQLPAIRKIPIQFENNRSDMRVHTMLFQRSGTGKGRGFNFTVNMAKELGLVCMKADSTTDATLLGSYLDDNGEQIHIRGLLDEHRAPPVNLLILNEATLILEAKKTDWSKDFMTYFQTAMNPLGTPDNLLEKSIVSMRGDIVSIQPEISLYLTTYPPEKLFETITKAGFIQRMITLYNIHTFDERVEHWKTMAAKTGRDARADNSIPEILAALQYINNHYKKNPIIMVAEETHAIFSSVMHELYRPLIKVNQAMREHLADFVPRTYENVVKLSYHHAITRLSPLVENIDVVYALNVIRAPWSRMISYMEENDELSRPILDKWRMWHRTAIIAYDILITMQRRRKIDTGGWIKKETFVTALSNKNIGWDKSKTTTRSRLDKMIDDMNWFEEKKIKGIKCIKLRSKSI